MNTPDRERREYNRNKRDKWRNRDRERQYTGEIMVTKQ